MALPARRTTCSPRGPARRRAKAVRPAADRFPPGVQEGRQDPRQQDVHEDEAEAPHLADEPEYPRANVGGEPLRQLATALQSRDLLPTFGEANAHERELPEPPGRRGHSEPRGGTRPLDQVRSRVHDRLDREEEGNREDDDQRQRHHQDGQRAAAPERRLHAPHDGPGRDHEHRRPDQGRQERPEHPGAGADQHAEAEHRERRTCQIPGDGCAVAHGERRERRARVSFSYRTP